MSPCLTLCFISNITRDTQRMRGRAKDGGTGKQREEEMEMERERTVEGEESAVFLIQAALQLSSCQA